MAIPIPIRASGFTVGHLEADVKIDVFIDLQCPHSRQLWPNLMAVREHYKDARLSITAHIITLSNHRQAWEVSLGVFALAQNNALTAFDFIGFLYSKQELFYNQPFLNKTHADLQDLVADFAVEFAGVDREEYRLKAQEHDVYIAARTPIRFAATRAVWATPTLFINNADDVPVDHRSTLSDWRAVLDSLLDQ